MAVSKTNKVIICILEASSFNINPKSDLVKRKYIKYMKVWDVVVSRFMYKYFHLLYAWRCCLEGF